MTSPVNYKKKEFSSWVPINSMLKFKTREKKKMTTLIASFSEKLNCL